MLFYLYVTDPTTFPASNDALGTSFSSENRLFIQLWKQVNIYVCMISSLITIKIQSLNDFHQTTQCPLKRRITNVTLSKSDQQNILRRSKHVVDDLVLTVRGSLDPPTTTSTSTASQDFMFPVQVSTTCLSFIEVVYSKLPSLFTNRFDCFLYVTDTAVHSCRNTSTKW